MSLDAASGGRESQELTTFINPSGRYAFRRLLFRITSTPEIFQRKIAKTLQGPEGTEVCMDDILVHGETKEFHDMCLKQVLEWIGAAGLKLNKDKCKFRWRGICFLKQCLQ